MSHWIGINPFLDPRGVWLKYKLHKSQEFVIGGYTMGNPFDALIVGCYDAGKLKTSEK